MTEAPPIIVFSHLRWDWVFQRPQHLLSRLARNRRIYFIEEPYYIEDGREPHWTFCHPQDNITVCNAFTAVPDPGFNDYQVPTLRRLVAELLRRENLTDYVIWFYTPMALPLIEGLEPKAIVYDVMDELSAFKGAPPQLLDRESETYKVADVVFIGGPSLFRSKQSRHHNVHCFPSSVDLAHYATARNAKLDPDDQKDLPHPRLGYFGVIDERMDLDLLDRMARAHPEWRIQMVGPVCKISPDQLPKHPNIRYYGQRPYKELPNYLSGWDVALLPFALNESTRFISPTKTLEYMAAEKMIVSTPITDVAEPYGDIMLIGDTPEAFIAACERALAMSEQERTERIEKMRAVLQRTSWDSTAEAMEREIHRAIEARAARRAARSSVSSSRAADEKTPIIIIGAGPTGLSACYHARDSLLLEKNNRVGGWCRSIQQNGFTFDYAGHIMFTKDPYVEEMYKILLGDNVHWQDREAWIYSKNVYTRYPFQGSLYGLPPDVIKECIMGAIEARFGALDEQKEHAPARPAAASPKGNGHAASADHQADRCTVGDVKDCCADGVLESTARLVPAKINGNGHGRRDGQLRHPGVQTQRMRDAAAAARTGMPANGSTNGQAKSAPPGNFEEFIYKVWGRGIAKHFAIPYNRKLWAVPLTEMETSWLGGRVPLPNLEEMIEGALSPSPKPMGPNARFGYPLRGGFQALMDGFLPHIKDRLRLNTGVVRVSPMAHTVTTTDGKTIAYDYLISTMPLPLLIRSMGNEAPRHIQEAAQALRYISVRCVNIGVGRENITDKHWIYYPEDTVFHRIFVQGNASPYNNAPGGFCFTCEITYSPEYKPLPCDGDDLIRLCIEDAIRVGFIRRDDPIWAANQVDMPHAYVVYDHARARNVKIIREWLAEHDIILAGRYSEWEYYNSDHAFVAGKRAVEKIEEMRSQRRSAPTSKTRLLVTS